MPPKYTKRLQELCIEKGLDYDVIVGPLKGRVLAYHRRHLFLQISEEFPKLSTPQLGELFGKDHSTIVQGRQKALSERTNGVTNEWLRSSLSTEHSVTSSPAKLIPYPGH